MAEALAKRGASVFLVARSGAALSDLAERLHARYGVPARTLALDLTDPDGGRRLFDETENSGLRIDILVNNAGVGRNAAHGEIPLDETLALLRLNVLAVVEISRRFLSAMRARRHGFILNVSSTAAFLPGPYLATYAASKAFVLSYSEALHEEGRREGVVVSCLCPGYTRTAFHRAAGMRDGEGGLFPVMDADRVAEIGLQALERGRAVVVTHPLDRAWIFASRLLPRVVPRRLAAALFSRSRLGPSGS